MFLRPAALTLFIAMAVCLGLATSTSFASAFLVHPSPNVNVNLNLNLNPNQSSNNHSNKSNNSNNKSSKLWNAKPSSIFSSAFANNSNKKSSGRDMSSLEQWARANQFQLSPNIELAKDDKSKNGKGDETTSDDYGVTLNKDSLNANVNANANANTAMNILSVPKSFVFDSDIIYNQEWKDQQAKLQPALNYIQNYSQKTNNAKADFQEYNNHFILILKLYQEYTLQTESKWYTWMSSLPATNADFKTGVNMDEVEMNCLPPFAYALASFERDKLKCFYEAFQLVPKEFFVVAGAASRNRSRNGGSTGSSNISSSSSSSSSSSNNGNYGSSTMGGEKNGFTSNMNNNNNNMKNDDKKVDIPFLSQLLNNNDNKKNSNSNNNNQNNKNNSNKNKNNNSIMNNNKNVNNMSEIEKMELFQWLFNVVHTRCWSYEYEEPLLSEGVNYNDSLDLLTPQQQQQQQQNNARPTPIIVPFGDMFNHREPANVFVQDSSNSEYVDFVYSNENELEFNSMTSNKITDDDKGLYLSYGLSNPHRFLVIFGFCDPTMPEVFSQLIFANPSNELVSLGCNDRASMVYRSEDGGIPNSIWDCILYTLLEQVPDEQYLFYNASVKKDYATLRTFHERYLLEAAMTLRPHVMSTVGELRELLGRIDGIIQVVESNNGSSKNSSSQSSSSSSSSIDEVHPRLLMIREHNQFLCNVFEKVRQRLDFIVEGEVKKRRQSTMGRSQLDFNDKR